LKRPSLSWRKANKSSFCPRSRAGGGTKLPKEKQQKDITTLDRFNNAAVVKVVAYEWVGYLAEVKISGEWKIVNVLCEIKPD
jgi:hypothetical protein